MNKHILACNWKMNPDTQAQTLNLIKEYQKINQQFDNLDLITFPPTIYLSSFTDSGLSFCLLYTSPSPRD